MKYSKKCQVGWVACSLAALFCGAASAASASMIIPCAVFAYAAGAFKADASWGAWLERKTGGTA